MLGSSPDQSAAVQEFARILADGIVRALASLNARTRFRFTTIYRYDRPLLRGVFQFDRENPAIGGCGPANAPDSCYSAAGISVGSDSSHAVPALDSSHSPSARIVFPGYAVDVSHSELALRSPSGALVGVLCHSDRRVRLLPGGERAKLRAIAALLATWLARFT
ncbi:MAG: hypothetical protein NVS4B3_12800 [Gemmatimonadaceae bacterium]